MNIRESRFKNMDEEKYNLAGNCVHGLDDPYFRHRVCYDATEMAGIVDEYGECMHGAFYDEEHFFNSWQTADEISKEEFWSNIDPLSEMYDELKELESDPEYPAEYRYNPNDDVYFIFVGDDTHYFFINPDSLDTLHDTEEEELNESIKKIKDNFKRFL